jgi:hypothetical protein
MTGFFNYELAISLNYIYKGRIHENKDGNGERKINTQAKQSTENGINSNWKGTWKIKQERREKENKREK